MSYFMEQLYTSTHVQQPPIYSYTRTRYQALVQQNKCSKTIENITKSLLESMQLFTRHGICHAHVVCEACDVSKNVFITVNLACLLYNINERSSRLSENGLIITNATSNLYTYGSFWLQQTRLVLAAEAGRIPSY